MGDADRVDVRPESGFIRGARASRDFWTVYNEHFERVVGATRSELAETTELLSPEDDPGPADLAKWRELVRAAVSGDWTALRAAVALRGERYAERGLSLRESCARARGFTRHLLPLLVEAYATEPLRLVDAIQVMNDFSEESMSTMAEAYLERQAEALRLREEDLATTLDSIGDAVIVTDALGRVMRLNPVAERLTGYSLSDCRWRPLEEVFRIENEETLQRVESPVPRVLREGTVVGLANHTMLVSRDGTRRPISDSGAPVRDRDGHVRGVVLVFRDVTEERRAEEALQHWERIFQHATWGVALATVDDIRFRAVNPAYARMHGYTVQELLGAPVSILWAPETKADMDRHAAETNEHGQLAVETVHVRKDGSRMPVELVATTMKDRTGKVTWFVANVQDITERRRLQQSRIRAIELEAENRRIEEADRLKSEFLANMSHELRTPLNSIIGFAELIHDEQVGAVLPKQREFLGDILSGGRHLLRLINDVLDLAKVEAGKMEFRPEPVELDVLVGSVVQGLRTAAFDRRVHVDVEVDPSLENIALDPGRFKQMLYNYVSNALKFTPEGGRVGVRAIPEGTDRFRLEVTDTGIGISPAHQRHLFNAFQQVDSGDGKRAPGTGLGLALTKRLAEAQGGDVGVHSELGRGSTFYAVLPRRPDGAALAPEWKPARSAVLVVEQDAAHGAILAGILAEAGYAVDLVSHCDAAIAAWAKRRYDAITLDLLWSGAGDGDLHALLQTIRADSSRPGVPVIAMTIVADSSAAAGFAVTDVLTKPVDPKQLLAALQRGGAPPTRGAAPIVVVDDDHASLRLMEATLARLGYDALCFSDAREALLSVQRVPPAAVILDLIMPGMDGLAFLERFRALPDLRRVPVMLWTVKDLSAEERQRFRAAVGAVVQKGIDDGSRLSAALQAFLGAPAPGERVAPC